MIYDNPFHILGVFADDSHQTISSRISRCRAYFSANRKIIFEPDLYFPLKNPLALSFRNSNSLDLATQKLNQSKEKLIYGLFWFIRDVDERINEVLFRDINEFIDKFENFDTSIDTQSNFIKIYNLSTAKIIAGIRNQNKELVLDGFLLKTKLFNKIEWNTHANYLMRLSDGVASNSLEKILIAFIEGFKNLKSECEKHSIKITDEEWRKSIVNSSNRFSSLVDELSSSNNLYLRETIEKLDDSFKLSFSELRLIVQDFCEFIGTKENGFGELSTDGLIISVWKKIHSSCISSWNRLGEFNATREDFSDLLLILSRGVVMLKDVDLLNTYKDSKENIESIAKRYELKFRYNSLANKAYDILKDVNERSDSKEFAITAERSLQIVHSSFNEVLAIHKTLEMTIGNNEKVDGLLDINNEESLYYFNGFVVQVFLGFVMSFTEAIEASKLSDDQRQKFREIFKNLDKIGKHSEYKDLTKKLSNKSIESEWKWYHWLILFFVLRLIWRMCS